MTKIGKLLGKPLIIINVGLELFAETLKEQEAEVIHVEWRPPAGGDPKMSELLSKLGSF